MPGVHPFFVHFPIALLCASLVAEAAAVVWKNEELSRVGWWTQLGGTVGLGCAVASGLEGASGTMLPAGAKPLFETHEQLAFAASSIFAVLFLWRIASRSQLPRGHKAAYLGLFAAGVAVMLLGAWYGGHMVYSFGAGVAPPPA